MLAFKIKICFLISMVHMQPMKRPCTDYNINCCIYVDWACAWTSCAWIEFEKINFPQIQSPISFPLLQVAAQELASNQLSSDLDLDKRMDMTHLQAWAIDNEHTTEVDDAISIEILPNGKKRVWVHVADPTCVLKPDSVLSKEALRRASTLYLPTGIFQIILPFASLIICICADGTNPISEYEIFILNLQKGL